MMYHRQYTQQQRLGCRLITLASIFILMIHGVVAIAQAPTISYPATAQNLHRAYSNSVLTVRLVFNGVCSGATTVKVALPAGISYVPGTVSKTAGTAAMAITESSISDLRNPVFSVTGITAVGDDITFTVARQTGCGSLSSAKDSVYVVTSGGCSNASELVPTVNTYNIFSPALSIAPPAAITGAVVGTTATRTTTITNGGVGLLDSLRFYIVYPGAGIVNTSGTNAITANSVNFTPSATSGDTLFYKIYGATLFGGDNVLNNGEAVTITEPIRVVKCNSATTYSAFWGTSMRDRCQEATATSSMTMALGVPNMAMTVSDTTLMGACIPGITKLTYANNGTGANAGAIYNITANLGISDLGGSLHGSDNGQTVGNFTLNAAPGTGIALTVATTGTAALPFVVNLSQLTTDPDATGTGLEDLDGDGQFDDLAPGSRFVIYMNRIYRPDTGNCQRSTYGANAGTTLNYTSMCGVAGVTLVGNGWGGNRWIMTPGANSTFAPPQIGNATPFTVGIAASSAYVPLGIRPTDSVECIVTLPAGITYAGGATFRGATPNTVFASGSQIHIYQKVGALSLSATMDFNLNLQYDCLAGSPPPPIPFTIRYVADRGCGAIDKMYCGTIVIGDALCGTAPCADGLTNTSVTVKRQTLGWTSQTLATRVTAASLPALSLQTVTVYDTVLISNSAIEGATAHSDLGFYMQLDKAASADLVSYISGTLNYKAFGSSTIVSQPVTAIPVTTGSTATLSKWNWNLSAMLGTGGIPATLSTGDSVWVDMLYRVSNANSNNLLSPSAPTLAPNATTYFYNTTSGSPVYCQQAIPALYFIGTNIPGGVLYQDGNQGTLVGCGSVYIRSEYASGHSAPIQPFPNEYRPKSYIDSIVFILPAGVVYDNTITPTYAFTKYSDKYTMVNVVVNTTAPVINGSRLTFLNPGTWGFSDFTKRQNNQSDSKIQFYVKSDCNAGTVTGPLSVGIQYFGKDFYYASPSPAIATNSVLHNSPSLGIDGTKRPSVTVQNNTGTVQGILPQHYWDVQVNSTGTVTAPYLWLALEKSTGAGGISIDSVVLSPGGTRLSPATYNTTDKWYQVSSAGLTSGSIQKARVYFKYTNCSLDSILLKAGWNCSGYPNPDPLTGYACTAAQTYLKVDPQPSQVQLSINRQPGGGSSINLCTVDSTLLIVNSAQAANLISPYVTIYPPAGLTIQSPVKVEYPLGSGNYQNAAVSTLAGGGIKIDLSAHTAIGSNGMLGTALSSSSFSPLGGDRQAKIKVDFSTDCSYSSGTFFVFNAYGNEPCGIAAVGNGISATTSALNITGASAGAGAAGVSMSFGGVSSLSCGSSAIPVSMTTTPTSVGTSPGDTMVYTLPFGLAYAGGLSAGFTADTSGSGGATVVKIAMPAAAANTAINYSFNVMPQKSNVCGNVTISAAYKRQIAPLSCGGTPCSSSSVIIASATSSAITLSKPNLVISSMATDSTRWMSGKTQKVYLKYSNNGTQAYTGNTDSVELFCGSSTTPFAVRALSKNLAIGATDSDTYSVLIPVGSCSLGDLVTARIQPKTAAGTTQCLCSGSSYQLSGVPLPLTFVSTGITAAQCAVTIDWTYNSTGSQLLQMVVERSDNGRDFMELANPAATVASYTEQSPYAGLWYYRLKAKSTDGSIAYSKALTVQTSGCSNGSLLVYPNPASHHLLVVLQGEGTGASFQLCDALGRVVLKGTLDHNRTNDLDVSSIPHGIYVIRILTANATESRQLHIAR